MALFRRNGKPLKFNIVDVEGAELAALTELIVSHGGETTDDEETIVKFTTQQKYGLKSYPRAKIYNVEFITECAKKMYFVDPEPYRFGKKVPYDECCMLHFLNQDNCVLERTSLPRVFSPGSTCLVSESDKEIAALLNFAQNSDMFCSNTTAGRLSQMMDIDETLFAQAIKSEPLSSGSNTVQPINEPSPILPNVHTKGYAPLRGCGDVVDTRVDNHEKRPCNFEFEHVVRPKLAAIAEDARKIAAAKETLNVLGSRQQPRSPRTHTRRRNGALRPPSPFGSGDNVKLPDSLTQRDPSTYDEEETVLPIKQEIVDIPSESGTPVNPSRLRIIPDARQRSLSPLGVKTASVMGWIPTKNARTNETLWGNDNVAMSANHNSSLLNPVANPVLREKSTAKSSEPVTSSMVLNIRHGGTGNQAISLQHTGNPSRADGTKRKHNARNISKSDNNPTIGQKRLTRREESGDEGNAGKGKGKQKLRKTSVDESTADRGKRNNATLEKSGDMINVEREDPSSSNWEKEETANGVGVGRRVLPNLRADLRERDNEYDSSDSSSGGSTPSIKRSRRDGISSVELSDDPEIDAKSDDDSSVRTQDDSWNQAGPSGLGNKRKHDGCEDEKSRNERHFDVSEHSSFITDSDKSDIDDDNDNRMNSEEIIVEPKIEDFLHPDLRPSRGQLWRSKLVKNQEQAPKYRKHFVPWEKHKMLRYLTERDCISMAKGLLVWKNMIAEGLLPHRTPQSLQNHFQKSLLPVIEDFEFLNETELQEFLALRVETGKK